MSSGIPLNRQFALLLIVAQISFVLGCGGGKGDPLKNIQKESTGVVKGEIHIDGQPKNGVRIYVFKEDNVPNGPVDPSNNMANGMTATGADGKFVFTTYSAFDGLPEGNYVLAFFWNGDGLSDEVSSDNLRTTKEANLFNKKYGNPAKSTFKVTAKKETPLDLGVLDLKTK